MDSFPVGFTIFVLVGSYLSVEIKFPVSPFWSVPVDIGVDFRSDSVPAIGDDQVGVSVAVDVHDATHPTAVVGKLASGPGFAGV